MKWAVIILNWNQAAATIRCANSLLAWKESPPDVWVVDNASNDGSREQIPRLCPAVSCLYNDVNLGFAGGNNVALRKIAASGAEAVLLLNNDARIAEDQALRLLAVLRDNPRLGVVGPLLEERQGNRRIVLAGGLDMARCLYTRRLLNSNFEARNPKLWSTTEQAIPNDHDRKTEKFNAKGSFEHFKNRIFNLFRISDFGFRIFHSKTVSNGLDPVEYVPGTAAMIRADLLRTVGLLDEAYFFSGEMADFCRRARLAGWTCAICPRSVAVHEPEAGTTRATLYRYYTLRNRFLFVRKHEPARRRRLFAFWSICGVLMVALAFVRGRPAQARAAWLALRDGLAGRFGNRNDLFGV